MGSHGSDASVPFQLVSIASVGFRSNGSHELVKDGRRCRRLVVAERSDGGGVDATGSEGGRGDAHHVRNIVGKLKAVVVAEGAHEVDRDSSS